MSLRSFEPRFLFLHQSQNDVKPGIHILHKLQSDHSIDASDECCMRMHQYGLNHAKSNLAIFQKKKENIGKRITETTAIY